MSTSTQMQPRIAVHIRWALRRDMPELLAIERSGHGPPWGEEEFLRRLRTRQVVGHVAEHGGRVLGFCVYELCDHSISICNLGVHPGHRRHGVGSQLVAKLIGKLSSERRTSVNLGLRETNLDAQLFFRAAGFRATDVLRGHFEDTGEDAYWMAYEYRGDR